VYVAVTIAVAVVTFGDTALRVMKSDCATAVGASS
jgi:hypothetical protein